MAVPCALIASCTDINPRDLVKQMLNVETLPTAEHVLEEVEAYPWHVNTKYYTADVRLCTTERRTIGDEEFANSVQALILLFDSKQELSFEQVKSWLPFAKEIDATVEMLVCKRCDPNDAIPKSRVQAWCLKQSFELVELDPETFSDEEEDDFPETTGVKRIVQALHAHMWPNLEMKESPSFRSPYMNQMMATEAEHKRTHNGSGPETVADGESEPTSIDVPAASASETPNIQQPPASSSQSANNIPAQPAASAKATTVSANPSKEEKDRANRQACQAASEDPIDSLINNDDIALFSALGNEETSDESFEQLFEKMQIMKQRAENLPPDQRRAYAEKVAITFWKAIGGDEDEIEGLSDDDP